LNITSGGGESELMFSISIIKEPLGLVCEKGKVFARQATLAPSGFIKLKPKIRSQKDNELVAARIKYARNEYLKAHQFWS